MPSAVLGDGTDSKPECIALFSVPHLTWPCLLLGPATSSPICVDVLIDHGSPLVLIDQRLTSKLGLHVCALPRAMPVTMAMSGEGKDPFLLTHYVQLSCLSLDEHFCSKSVCALLALNLCMPLLLGMPFLSHNCIVIDHELHTCIAKNNNYNLLHPLPIQWAATSPQSDRDLKKCMYDYWQRLANELKYTLPELKDIIDEACEPVKEVDVVATIKLCTYSSGKL